SLNKRGVVLSRSGRLLASSGATHTSKKLPENATPRTNTARWLSGTSATLATCPSTVGDVTVISPLSFWPTTEVWTHGTGTRPERSTIHIMAQSPRARAEQAVP